MTLHRLTPTKMVMPSVLYVPGTGAFPWLLSDFIFPVFLVLKALFLYPFYIVIAFLNVTSFIQLFTSHFCLLDYGLGFIHRRFSSYSQWLRQAISYRNIVRESEFLARFSFCYIDFYVLLVEIKCTPTGPRHRPIQKGQSFLCIPLTCMYKKWTALSGSL